MDNSQFFRQDSQELPAYEGIMSASANNQTIFWEIQLSIAKAVASMEKPSLARLHRDIVEEIGQHPGEKLLDYFLGITQIPNEEKEEYFKYIGISKTGDKETVVPPAKADTDRPADLAATIACGDTPTVLRFRQAHIKEYGEPPSTELIEFFLKKIPEPPRVTVDSGGTQNRQEFVEKIAANPNVTVLKFRESFTKQFGESPPTALTQYFLEKSQENSGSSDKTVPLESDSKATFAKRAAKQNITTILQFRKQYEKVYNEAPANELIDIFIKNLPKI